jgi:hypothetical protein
MDQFHQVFARISVGMGDILAVGKEGLQSLDAVDALAALVLAAVDKAELHTLAAADVLAEDDLAADKAVLPDLAVSAAPAAVFEDLEG